MIRWDAVDSVLVGFRFADSMGCLDFDLLIRGVLNTLSKFIAILVFLLFMSSILEFTMRMY